MKSSAELRNEADSDSLPAEFNTRLLIGRMNLMNRRKFMKLSIAGTAGAGLGSRVAADALAASGTLPKKPLGWTGEMVSMFGLGGWNMGNAPSVRESVEIIHAALDLGVNFLDCAVSYQDGGSEERYGIGLEGKRKDVFLMTKSTQRTRQGFDDELHGSLKRFRTDYIDLYQFHSMRAERDVETIFGPGGAMEAAAKAQKEGKVRYLGMTSHVDPNLLILGLEKWDGFAAMQMPINVLDPHYLSNLKIIVPRLVEKNIAVLAMKTISAGNIIKHNVASVAESLRFVWSQPVTVLISGCDSPAHVRENVLAAVNFKPMTDLEKETLLARTQSSAGTIVESYKRKI